MALNVIWTEIALSDLESVADYIAKDSSHYAAVFVQEIKIASRSLTEFARRGRIVPELSDPDIRELLIRDYRLIYNIARNKVYIIAFIHGARDLTALWGQKET